jgi:hypothetical protein
VLLIFVYLPEITIQSIIDDGVDKDLTITSDDIPTPDKNRDISVCYSKVEGANIEKTPKKETLNLKAFIIPCDKLDENGYTSPKFACLIAPQYLLIKPLLLAKDRFVF